MSLPTMENLSKEISTSKTDINTLKGYHVKSGYNGDTLSSHTYELRALQCYIVVIASVGNSNASNLSAWLVATGGSDNNTGTITRIAGTAGECTLDVLNLTVKHSMYAIVSIQMI